MTCLLPAAAPAYLLIAQPHSSSTSALVEARRMAQLSGKQERGWGTCARPARWARWFALSVAHLDVCFYGADGKIVTRWATSRTTLYKQHLVPAAEHAATLTRAGARAVVLLRDAWSSAHAYCQRERRE